MFKMKGGYSALQIDLDTVTLIGGPGGAGDRYISVLPDSRSSGILATILLRSAGPGSGADSGP